MSAAKKLVSPEERERRRAESAKRMQNPEYREIQKQRHRDWRERNPTTDAERARKAADMRRYRMAPGTRTHHLARDKVKKALESGRLTRQPCEVCGADRVEAHHDDYSRPLEVRWLCAPHHRAHHAKAEGSDVSALKDGRG